MIIKAFSLKKKQNQRFQNTEKSKEYDFCQRKNVNKKIGRKSVSW